MNRIASAMIPVLVGLALGFGSYQLVAWSGAGSDSGAVNPNATPSAPPEEPPTDDTETTDAFLEEVKEAVDAANEQPVFTGDIGSFEVVGLEEPSNFGCAQDVSPIAAESEQLRQSELYFEVEGGLDGFHASGPNAGTCEDLVIFVSGDALIGDEPSDNAHVARYYFVGEQLQVTWTVTEGQLETFSIAGRESLIARPPHPSIPGCQLAVIERLPSAEAPGVALGIEGPLSCEAAVSFADSLISGLEEDAE